MRYLAILLLSLAGIALSTIMQPSPRAIATQRLREIAVQDQKQLGISEQVAVFIVPNNERLASVLPSHKLEHTFILEVDEKFLGTLNEEEQRAMIAHELGHVWIFTHQPYIQSEPLANQMAEHLVNQGSLVQIYEKVWRIDGQPGTLQEYLAKKVGMIAANDSPSSRFSALATGIRDRDDRR